MSHPSPYEYVCHLEGGQGEDLILILDASESAAPRRGNIIRLALETLAELPADVRVQIYFLGNPQAYSARELDTQAPAWFESNALRASLISSVLESLSPGNTSTNLPVPPFKKGGRRGDFSNSQGVCQPPKIPPNPPLLKGRAHDFQRVEACPGAYAPREDAILVVLGNGLIYDLEDWRDSPFWHRLRLVNVGAALQPAGAGLPELNAPSAQMLRQSLYDPVTAIELWGPGFLPLAWDVSAYRRIEDQGVFVLRGEHPPAAPLTVRCLLCRDASLNVERHHASGRVSRHEMSPLSASSRAADGRLTPEEVTIFDQACRQHDFTCPHCGKTHAWDTLRCRVGRAIIVQPIFSSLPGQRGFVQLYRDAEGADYRLVGEALPLGDGLVALREDTHARLVRFDPASAHWRPEAGEFFPYQPLGISCYGLLL